MRRNGEFFSPGGCRLGPRKSDGAAELILDGDPAATVRLLEFGGSPWPARFVWVGSSTDGESEDRALARRGELAAERKLSMGQRGLTAEYTVVNTGERLIRPSFGVGLEIARASVRRWSVPTAEGIASEVIGGACGIRYVRPARTWLTIGTRIGLSLCFPARGIDAVEVLVAGETVTLSALVYFVGLHPGQQARIPFLVTALDPETVRESAAALEPACGPAPADRIDRCRSLEARADPSAERRRLDGNTRLRDRATRLAGGRHARLDAIDRWARGEIGVEEAEALLVAGAQGAAPAD